MLVPATVVSTVVLVWFAFAPTVVSEYREPRAIPYVGHSLEMLGPSPLFMEWTYDNYTSKLLVYGRCSSDQFNKFLSIVDVQLNNGFENDVFSIDPQFNFDSPGLSYVDALPDFIRSSSRIAYNDPILLGLIETSTGSRIRVAIQRSPETGELSLPSAAAMAHRLQHAGGQNLSQPGKELTFGRPAKLRDVSLDLQEHILHDVRCIELLPQPPVDLQLGQQPQVLAVELQQIAQSFTVTPLRHPHELFRIRIGLGGVHELALPR